MGLFHINASVRATIATEVSGAPIPGPDMKLVAIEFGQIRHKTTL